MWTQIWHLLNTRPELWFSAFGIQMTMKVSIHILLPSELVARMLSTTTGSEPWECLPVSSLWGQPMTSLISFCHCWGEDTVSFLGHLRGIMSQAPSPVAGDTSWRRGQGDCSPISSIAKIRFIFYQLKGIIRTTPATTISIWTYLQWFQNRRHIYTMRLLIAWNSLYLQTSQEVTMWLSTLLSSTSFFDTLSQVSLPPWRRSSEWMSGTILAVNFNEFIVMLSFLQSVLCSYCFYEFQWKKYPKWIC